MVPSQSHYFKIIMLFFAQSNLIHHYFTCCILLFPEFIFYFMQFSVFQGFLNTYFTGTTIKHLTGAGLSKLPIPLCPYDEQLEIVQHLNEQFSCCDQIDNGLLENLEKSQALRQSILKRAFSGQLVSQDPNDEPASELLKRIAAEKGTKIKTTQRTKKS